MTRGIAWVAGFGIAVTVALLMRGLGSDWLATVSTALTFLVLPDNVGKAQPYHRDSETIPTTGPAEGRRDQRQMSLNGSGDIAV
jgi:hypothetical protein